MCIFTDDFIFVFPTEITNEYEVQRVFSNENNLRPTRECPDPDGAGVCRVYRVAARRKTEISFCFRRTSRFRLLVTSAKRRRQMRPSAVGKCVRRPSANASVGKCVRRLAAAAVRCCSVLDYARR